MDNKTKLALLVPVVYAACASMFLAASWPEIPNANHYIGATVTCLSFVFWIIARIQLGNAFSIAPKSKFIVTSGIYAKLRHPVYYFSITAVLGLAIYSLHVLALIALVVLVALELVRIHAEEKTTHRKV